MILYGGRLLWVLMVIWLGVGRVYGNGIPLGADADEEMVREWIRLQETAMKEEECDVPVVELPDLQRNMESTAQETQCSRLMQSTGGDGVCVGNSDLALLREDLIAMEGRSGGDVWADIVLAWHNGWNDLTALHEDLILSEALIFSPVGRAKNEEMDSLLAGADHLNMGEDDRSRSATVKAIQTATRFAESHPSLGARYASADIMRGMNSYHLLRAMASADTCARERRKEFEDGGCHPELLPVDENDVQVWKDVFDATSGEKWFICKQSREDPCSCSRVMCESQWSRNKRVIVTLHLGSMGLRGTLPDSFANFLHLRAVRFFDEPFLDSQTSQYPILRLPALRSLLTDAHLDALTASTEDFSARRHLVGVQFQTDEFRGGRALVHAPKFQWICGLTNLRTLHVSGAVTGLPACIGYNNSNLVEIDLRGAQLGKAPDKTPLPLSLGRLTQMKSFVAFQQGARPCPPKHLRKKPGKLKKECRLNYDTLSGGDGALWLCKEDGWFVDFSDRLQPWWRWTRLERFWVDANYFYGKIPPFIGTAWPSMRSIDIYTNNLSGPIPYKSLARMRHLNQLQFQDNNLEGEIPPGTFTPQNFPRLYVLNLQLNRNLKGCIATAPWVKASHEYRGVFVGGTPNIATARSGVVVRPDCSSYYAKPSNSSSVEL